MQDRQQDREGVEYRAFRLDANSSLAVMLLQRKVEHRKCNTVKLDTTQRNVVQR